MTPTRKAVDIKADPHSTCENCKHSCNIDGMKQYKRKNKWEWLYCEVKDRLINAVYFVTACGNWEKEA